MHYLGTYNIRKTFCRVLFLVIFNNKSFIFARMQLKVFKLSWTKFWIFKWQPCYLKHLKFICFLNWTLCGSNQSTSFTVFPQLVFFEAWFPGDLPSSKLLWSTIPRTTWILINTQYIPIPTLLLWHCWQSHLVLLW